MRYNSFIANVFVAIYLAAVSSGAFGGLFQRCDTCSHSDDINAACTKSIIKGAAASGNLLNRCQYLRGYFLDNPANLNLSCRFDHDANEQGEKP